MVVIAIVILSQAPIEVTEINKAALQVQIGKLEVGIKVVKGIGIIKPGEVRAGIKAIGIKAKISGNMEAEVVKIMEITVAGVNIMDNMLKVGDLR